jgi:hypothetical protein
MPSTLKLDTCDEGFLAYKFFGTTTHQTPPNWVVESGSIIEENCDWDRTQLCGFGVNVATLDWIMSNPLSYSGTVWKVLIRWEWGPGIVIPYNSDGKFRCEKCELVDELTLVK